jgi:NAD(P)H-dependent FMN reductase
MLDRMSVGDTNSEIPDREIRIAVIVGSTRPGRRGDAVAAWARHVGSRRDGAVFEVLDIARFGLPLLDEPVPAAIGDYRHPHTLAWSKAVSRFDGYVFVVPEYNHSVPAAVKNAIDFLYREWHDKAAGLVSYGTTGGIRAAEHLRLILAEVKVACVRSQVTLSLGSDFQITDITQPGTFTPAGHQEAQLERLLDELAAWSRALRACRPAAPAGTVTAGSSGGADDHAR